MINVFVGDVSQYLADIARCYDASAELITEKNYKKISDGIKYCSLGDFNSVEKFIHALRQADEIIYTPPDQWTSDTIQQETERCLLDLKILEYRNVKNTDHLQWPLLTKFLNLVDQRKTPNAQLWIAGCSISHGMGVTPDLRYGQLIANSLGLPVSFLTCPGSSVSWAADQILRSDLRPGDIVVWGITSFERFCYCIDDQVSHINGSYYQENPRFDYIIPLKELSSQNQIYQNIVKIYQVRNFLNKLGIRYVLAGLLTDLAHFNIIDDHYISLTQNHKSYPNDMLELDVHPGPNMHQWYAEQILKALN